MGHWLSSQNPTGHTHQFSVRLQDSCSEKALTQNTRIIYLNEVRPISLEWALGDYIRLSVLPVGIKTNPINMCISKCIHMYNSYAVVIPLLCVGVIPFLMNKNNRNIPFNEAVSQEKVPVSLTTIGDSTGKGEGRALKLCSLHGETKAPKIVLF